MTEPRTMDLYQRLPTNLKPVQITKLTNRILHVKRTPDSLVVYYFNIMGRYTYEEVKPNTLPRRHLVWQTINDAARINERDQVRLPDRIGDVPTDEAILQTAIRELKENDDFGRLVHIYNGIVDKKNRRNTMSAIADYDQFKNRIIKKVSHGKKTWIYFFDDKLKYDYLELTQAQPLPKRLVWPNDTRFNPQEQPMLPYEIKGRVMCRTTLYLAVCKMKIGETPFHLLKYYDKLTAVREHGTEQMTAPPPTFDTVDKFVLRIDRPTIERMSDNQDKSTFDFVRIFISIPQKHPDRMGFVKDHLDEINRMALEKIRQNRTYQKYDVPVNFLRLTEYIVTQQSELMLLYELKEV